MYVSITPTGQGRSHMFTFNDMDKFNALRDNVLGALLYGDRYILVTDDYNNEHVFPSRLLRTSHIVFGGFKNDD